MKLALLSPVVTRFPGGHASWEALGTVDDLAGIAAAAEQLGFDHLTCSEHVAVPVEHVDTRGGCYWDPLATFGYLAARTTSIRLATNVLVLGYHHPLAIAKRYGTLDTVSNGRLVLGVGVGSLHEEFDLLGVPFEGRGASADEALRALRACLSAPQPEHRGHAYPVTGFVVDPCAVQASVPIWVGGRTARSLRRAVELADGWCPFNVTPSDVRRWLDRHELRKGFEVVLGVRRPLDPEADPDGAVAELRALQDAGATMARVQLRSASARHFVEQLDAISTLHAHI